MGQINICLMPPGSGSDDSAIGNRQCQLRRKLDIYVALCGSSINQRHDTLRTRRWGRNPVDLIARVEPYIDEHGRPKSNEEINCLTLRAVYEPAFTCATY